MFDNIGGKIKALAKVVCWVGIIVFCLIGLIIMAAGQSAGAISIGVLTAGIGSLLSWVGSFFTYGFGQLIENSDILVKSKDNMSTGVTAGSVKADEVDLSKDNMSTSVTAGSVKADEVDLSKVNYVQGTCQMCGVETLVTDCKIDDDLGIRYRKICPECIKKYNAKPIEE